MSWAHVCVVRQRRIHVLKSPGFISSAGHLFPTTTVTRLFSNRNDPSKYTPVEVIVGRMALCHIYFFVLFICILFWMLARHFLPARGRFSASPGGIDPSPRIGRMINRSAASTMRPKPPSLYFCKCFFFLWDSRGDAKLTFLLYVRKSAIKRVKNFNDLRISPLIKRPKQVLPDKKWYLGCFPICFWLFFFTIIRANQNGRL